MGGGTSFLVKTCQVCYQEQAPDTGYPIDPKVLLCPSQ